MTYINQQEVPAKIGRGIIVENLRSRVVGNGGVPAREYLRDSVLTSTPKKSKEADLPSRASDLTKNSIPEAQILCAGQDSVGTVTFDSGKIQAVLVAADGCSFADRIQAAQAAEYAVMKVLSAGDAIATGELGDHSVETGLTAAISLANKEILKKFPQGATTMAAAAIAVEPRADGTKRILCYVSACGDASINILGTRKDGSGFMRRLNGNADALDRIAAVNHQGFFDKDPVERKAIREAIIRATMKNGNMTREAVEDMLVRSGVTACLGESGTRFFPEMQKYDVSNLFADGVSNIKILACSDNAGDKIPSKEIVDLYLRAKNNRVFSEELLKLMMTRDQDDGCSAIIDVGRVKI